MAGSSDRIADPWFRVVAGCPHPEVRVVCFPHAGGSASYFRTWARFVPDRVEVLAVCYPGREDRFAEPQPASLDQLADQIADAGGGLAGVPLILFGHSMGALVAYETAVRLRARSVTLVVLCVSGVDAPGQLTESDFANSSDADLLAEFDSLDGTDTDLFDYPELVDLVLPIIRSDYRICEDYARARNAVRPTAVLSAPIAAYFGDRDPELDLPGVAAWSELTLSTFVMRVFTGGHFYLAEHAEELVKDVLGQATGSYGS
jgi:pyochelin biosynthesis protein PchC